MDWVYLLCVLAVVVTARPPAPFENHFIPPENRDEIIKNLRNLFERHKDHAYGDVKNDDLFCKCNEPGCDKEIIEVAGHDFHGICRISKGGQCLTVESFNEAGQLREMHLTCLNHDVLFPHNRPFQCHPADANPKVRAFCCNNASLCNDVEIPELYPMHVYEVSLEVLVIVLLVLAIVGGACCVTVFVVSSAKTKAITRILTARLPFISVFTRPQPANSVRFSNKFESESLVEINDSNAYRPDELLDNPDSSGFGLASLSRRTIARQIQIHNIVSKGRFGEVWLGDWRGEQVAVKIFNSRDEQSWWRETEIYTTNTLRHANILRWIASDNKDAGACTQLWLVTEFMPNGSLYDYLEKHALDKNTGLQMLRSILHGMSYLHAEVPGIKNQCYKPPIAHRDLKSKNVLVKADGTCVIADFGLAVRYIHGKLEEIENKRVGTIRYMAPEFLMDDFPRKFISYLHGDVYALSLIIWEIARRINYMGSTGAQKYELPYFEHIKRDPSVDDMRAIVVEQEIRPSVDPGWRNDPLMAELTRVMEECWCVRASSRLTMLNIRNCIEKMLNPDRASKAGAS